MKFNRASGILLHPTSLPGHFGIGDIGPQAYKWIDFLAGAGCSLWQMLPLGPTGFGDSPYQCFSAFAGNPYLISPEALVQDGLLEENVLIDHPIFHPKRVEFGSVIPWKLAVLRVAFQRFLGKRGDPFRESYRRFRQENASWLEDYSLFMALKEANGGAPWNQWDKALRLRHPQSMQAASIELAEDIERIAFWQFLFFRQWEGLREYAHRHGIIFIGDAPIFVAEDSADLWANQELFHLDGNGHLKFQAGVPPDYFSQTGQLWGNPLYRWRAHKTTGYSWWIARIRAVLRLVDIVRLDHFRGFAGYWQVPRTAKTAENGRWVKAPGMDFLRRLKAALGDLPIIAEDLGVITPDVIKLRDAFKLPGMKVVQYAFLSDPKDPFLPHNYPVNCVVYTGTHDNDTTTGWFSQIPETEKSFCLRYLDRDGRQIAWDLIRASWASVACFALAPLQDFLGLGSEARMNRPGTPSGNWTWRMVENDLSEDLKQRIREINFIYNRLNPKA